MLWPPQTQDFFNIPGVQHHGIAAAKIKDLEIGTAAIKQIKQPKTVTSQP